MNTMPTYNTVPFVTPEVAETLNLYPSKDLPRPQLIGYWRESPSTLLADTWHGRRAAEYRATHEKLVATDSTGGYNVSGTFDGEDKTLNGRDYAEYQARYHARLAVDAAQLPWPGHYIDPAMLTEDRERVAAALDAAPIVVRYCGYSWDRLSDDRTPNGSGERGVAGYVWPEGLSTYVRKYGLRLPDEFLQAIGAYCVDGDAVSMAEQASWTAPCAPTTRTSVMPEAEKTPSQRLRETLRRNTEMVEALPAWVRSAMSVDAVFSVAPRPTDVEDKRADPVLENAHPSDVAKEREALDCE